MGMLAQVSSRTAIAGWRWATATACIFIPAGRECELVSTTPSGRGGGGSDSGAPKSAAGPLGPPEGRFLRAGGT